MKVSCPTCGSNYTIADQKVAGRKVKVRCKSCGGHILVDGSHPGGAPQDDEEATRVFTAEEREQVLGSEQTQDGWVVSYSDTDEREMTTQQIVDAALRGELEGEIYVWRDGLADWTLLMEVDELKSAIDTARTGPHSPTAEQSVEPKTASARRGTQFGLGPEAAAVVARSAAADVAPASATGVQAPGETKPAGTVGSKGLRATRLGIGAQPAVPRTKSTHDLFAAVDRAGSESEERIVKDSEAPEPVKLTGARNENSVLFSLDALKAGIGAAPPPQKATGERGAPTKRIEDLMSAGGGAMVGGAAAPAPLLLSGNQALLTAPAPPPPKPKPEPAPVVAASTTVTIAPAKNNKVVLLAAAAAVVVIGGIAFALGTMTAGSDAAASAAPTTPSVPASATEKTAANEPATASSTATATASTSASATASASAEPSAEASAKPVAQEQAAHPTAEAKTTHVTQTSTPKPETSKTPEVTKKAKPSAGVASFNTAAARQALSVAAAQATSCKRPGGPTGRGRVLVTFATSGRVTTANVAGAPFGGTVVGGCVAGVFRRAQVPSFSGAPVTVSKSFSILP